MNRFKFLFNSSLGKIALLFLTFFIGVGSIYFWFEVSQPKVTLCQLARNPEWYDGKTITVEAEARSYNGSIVMMDESCRVYESNIRVWSIDGYKPSGEAIAFYQESKTEIRRARILVTGRFDANARINCFTPKWAIHATNVEIKSTINTETIELPKETEFDVSKHFVIC